MTQVSQGEQGRKGALWPAILLAAASGCAGEPAKDGLETGSVPDTSGALSLPANATVLDHARLVDARGVQEDVAIVLEGAWIAEVLPAGQDWPADATVTDLDGASVVPGLIDAHVHLFLSGATTWVGDTLAANLEAQLAWGVVGVADLGAPTPIFELRDRIAAGELQGPRIYATGPFLTAELSHPCEVVNDPTVCRYVDGDGAAAVSELAASDAIKVALADASFTDWPTPRLDLGDLADIVDEATAEGKPVFAHIDEAADAEDALAAGVSVLAHPVFSEVLDSAPDAPTLSTVSAFAGTHDVLDGSLLADDLSQTPDAVRKSWVWIEGHPDALAAGWIEGSEAWDVAARANLSLAIAEGRDVIAGSDAGYWFVPHGLGLHRELEALVDLGVTPLQALAAATTAPAELLGWDDLGLIDAGYRADLLVLDGRPDEDIAALRQIQAIYLDGSPYTPSTPTGSAAAAAGAFCLDDADCAAGACDRVDHLCRAGCDTPYDRVGSCDSATWCMPADGVATTGEGVCHPGNACDLYAQDCQPASYGEGCVPVDLDTNVCLRAGPRTEGQSCSWTDPDYLCEQGLFCSWVDYTCYRLCDPDDASACRGCTRQYIEGQPWFGLCL